MINSLKVCKCHLKFLKKDYFNKGKNFSKIGRTNNSTLENISAEYEKFGRYYGFFFSSSDSSACINLSRQGMTIKIFYDIPIEDTAKNGDSKYNLRLGR